MKRLTQGEIARQAPIVRAMREAFDKFGPANDENVDYIARWVQRRVEGLTSPADNAETFDAKLKASGE